MVNYEEARQQFIEWRAEDREQLERALAQTYNERMLYRALIFLLLLVISG
jgi:hypothetical protein